ncbi:MAG: AMP-binding protein [Acidimicrobiaceae bacterium]|nr:AMP-binding protein [Acidimicrobiaceae bacterium]
MTAATVAGWSRRTIADILDEQAEQRGEQVFLYLDDRPVTYREMRSRSLSGAAALAGLGVGSGDRVALMMATSLEWVATWFAAARLGAVAVPINTAYRGDFLAAPLLDSASTILAVDRSLFGRVADVAGQLSGLRWVLVREDAPPAGGNPDPGPLDGKVLGIDSLWEPAPADAPAAVPGASWDQPLAIFFTSGTTGRSKGALTTHQYLLSAAAAMVDCWQLQPGETVYAPLPLFHLSAVGSVLGPLIAGGTGVIDRVFSVSNTWERVREHGACGILLAGAMVVMLWNLPAEERDRQLPIRFFSAAPVPGELYRGIEQRYACKVVTAYGLSEAFPVVCAGVADDNPPGASGRANPRLEVAVVDHKDDLVPPGTVGEIVCRPREPHVMFEGYDGRPAETLAQLGNLWFHTGDLGRLDEAGNLTYVDRKKDAMRRRGENISSFEVEQVLLQHPAVAEAAAIGVPSEVGEDDVMACLTLKPGAALEMVELMDFCAGRMPYFAVPRYVDIIDQLPKNVIGRVLKPELRERGVTSSTWDREQAGYVVRR